MKKLLYMLVAAAALLGAQVAHAARLKDIADVEGVRSNQLIGYGVVVGLNGTGDVNRVDFTLKTMSNYGLVQMKREKNNVRPIAMATEFRIVA